MNKLGNLSLLWALRLTLAFGLIVAIYIAIDMLTFHAVQPKPSYLLLDREQRFLAEVGAHNGEMGYWPVDALPPRVVAATLVLEDRRFWNHPGIDIIAMARALQQNATARTRVSGASTLAMQVARLSDPGARSYTHKARETWRALAMTLRDGREQVLHDYLRLVPYGNHIHGIAYAARRYLDKPVADLSWAEVALLTAIPQSPTRMNPFHEGGRQRAIARGQRILDALHAQQVLTDSDFEIASTQIQALQILRPAPRPMVALHAVEKLTDDLAVAPPRTGPEPYRIVTTLDLDLQLRVVDHAQAELQHWEARGAHNAAVIVTERATGRVRAWMGSLDYFDRANAGALDYARIARSPGSVLKPFIYALALERGRLTPATVMDDLHAAPGGITNVDHRFLGPMLPRQALANSRNVPAVELLNTLGLNQVYEFLRLLRLHDAADPATRYGAGLALGALPMKLENIVAAYSTLANDGLWRPLQWSETDLPSHGQRLLSPEVARIVTSYLADPNARLPSFARMGTLEYPFPVALKTGTSQGARDAWTLAYSRRYLVGVWMGDANERPMHDVTGAAAAGALAQRILLDLQPAESQGMTDVAFPPPEHYQAARICALTGMRATPACEPVFEEWFAPGTVPAEVDTAFVQVSIDARTGARAHAATPVAFRTVRRFANLPMRYAEWSAEAGYAAAPRDDFNVRVAAATSRSLDAVHAHITAPRDGEYILRDPSVPPELSTIALRVEAEPPVAEVLWRIDDQPYQLVPYPYSVRWRVTRGVHTLRVEIPSVGLVGNVVKLIVE
ncbi:MAG: penicillin-binding protein 1C [Gammaproteobacteria bacterium]|nr:penicillin-binding protein 1C [Gammaproteobacteria bacterium]